MLLTPGCFNGFSPLPCSPPPDPDSHCGAPSLHCVLQRRAKAMCSGVLYVGCNVARPPVYIPKDSVTFQVIQQVSEDSRTIATPLVTHLFLSEGGFCPAQLAMCPSHGDNGNPRLISSLISVREIFIDRRHIHRPWAQELPSPLHLWIIHR